MRPNTKKTQVRRETIPRSRPPAQGHCMRMLGVLSDYLDRTARSRLCRKIEQHLRDCPDCRMYVDTMRKTVVLYRSLGDEKVPPDVSRRLFQTIRLAEAGRKSIMGKTRELSKSELQSNKIAAKRRKTCLS